MVVLPFVPVTPTRRSRSEGAPQNSWAARPAARSVEAHWRKTGRAAGEAAALSSESGSAFSEKCRAFWEKSCVFSASGGISSQSTAAAPARRAAGMNWWPSACVPRTAMKRLPGSTFRESMATPVISMSALPRVARMGMRRMMSVSFILVLRVLFLRRWAT